MLDATISWRYAYTMENNTCRDCAHFYPHYVKGSKKFREIECGHCMHKKPTPAKKVFAAPCARFEPRDQKVEKISRNTSLREVIINMQKKLEELLQILTVEEKEEI